MTRTSCSALSGIGGLLHRGGVAVVIENGAEREELALEVADPGEVALMALAELIGEVADHGEGAKEVVAGGVLEIGGGEDQEG